jgi:hypothetical protein
VKIEAVRQGDGYGIEISRDGEPSDLSIPSPVVLEVLRDADGDSGFVHRISAVYATATRSGGVLVGHAEVDGPRGRYAVTDTWTDDGGSALLERQLRATADAPEAVRLLLEATVAEGGVHFEDLQLFAPPALYDLNDIDRDGVEDYLDTRHMTFRDDRLTALSVLAYDPARHVGVALSRRDAPEFQLRCRAGRRVSIRRTFPITRPDGQRPRAVGCVLAGHRGGDRRPLGGLRISSVRCPLGDRLPVAALDDAHDGALTGAREAHRTA